MPDRFDEMAKELLSALNQYRDPTIEGHGNRIAQSLRTLHAERDAEVEGLRKYADSAEKAAVDFSKRLAAVTKERDILAEDARSKQERMQRVIDGHKVLDAEVKRMKEELDWLRSVNSKCKCDGKTQKWSVA